MAFKTVKTYNEEKFGGLFLLRNDGDYADVVFLYQNIDDVLVADVHYIKSADYNGYVHCNGRGCPACNKGIRVQTKLFIPVYDVNKKEIQFFDRTMRFEPQLHQDVFNKYPNPCDFVFRITRHGQPNDVNTTYEIQAVGRNEYDPYAKILADNNAKFPDYYENICKELSNDKMCSMLNASTSSDTASASYEMPSYQVTPRAVTSLYSGSVDDGVTGSCTGASIPEPVTAAFYADGANSAETDSESAEVDHVVF